MDIYGHLVKEQKQLMARNSKVQSLLRVLSDRHLFISLPHTASCSQIPNLSIKSNLKPNCI